MLVISLVKIYSEQWGLIMAANNIGVLGGFVLSTLSYNHLGMNFYVY